jgi:hypothetical protein
VGIFVFSESFSWLEKIYNGNYLGYVKVTETLGIPDGLFVFIFALVALTVFYITALIGRRIKEVNY